MKIDPSYVIEARREICRRSLVGFIKQAWPIVEPGQPYVHGRHIDVMGEVLEAVTRGEERRVLFNVPPGTMKSLMVNVFWPMWEWGPQGLPHLRSVGASHEQGLGVRDNLKCRRLLLSPWYQRLWPHVQLTKDQSEKIKFENTATGFREVATPSNITGRRGDRVVADDPLSAQNANSAAEREKVNMWFREALPTRVNNPDKSAIVVVMQRLHERDMSSAILELGGWTHVMLPMRYEAARACPLDWRKREGELLFPERFPESVVDELERSLGAYASAGQLQQRPAPREGGLFKPSWFSTIRAMPSDIIATVRAWDLAATKQFGTNDPDYTAGIVMSKTRGGRYIVHGCRRFRGSPMEVERAITSQAAIDGPRVTIRLPQDPGQAGKAQADALVRALAGHAVKIVRPTGDKASRATPLAVQAEAGNVDILVTGDAAADAWMQPFLDELCLFPAGAHDDQIDAAADAFNQLALGHGTYSLAALA